MDKSKLIAKHLDDKLFITKGSVEYYLKTGKVNGVLRGILIEMLQDFQDNERKGNQANSENANCAIFDVSLSLANQRAIEYAKLKHSDEYNAPAFERDISETELDFARGFIACSEYLKANEH